jgi:hypothetical protein
MSAPAPPRPPSHPDAHLPSKPVLVGLVFVWAASLLAAAVLVSVANGSGSTSRVLDATATATPAASTVGTGKVKTVIDASGRVIGELKRGTSSLAGMSSALGDRGVPADRVPQHTTSGGFSWATSVWRVVTVLLPFVALLDVYFWITRWVSPRFAAGVMALGPSRANNYEHDRSSANPMAAVVETAVLIHERRATTCPSPA